MSDAHIKDPVSDIKDQMESNDPGLVIRNNPIPPPMPSMPSSAGMLSGTFGIQNADVLRGIQSAVDYAFERVRINGTSPRFQGNAIEFDLPQAQTPAPLPVVSRITDPPRQEIVTQTPRLDAGPQTPRLDAGPQTPRLDAGPQTPRLDGEMIPQFGQNDVAQKADEDKKPDYTSKERLEGESLAQFKERQELLQIPKVAAAIANGDTTFFTSGYYPILLTRGDGQRVILAYIPEDTTYVVEGAVAGEKTRSMPPTNAYYTASNTPPPLYPQLKKSDALGDYVNISYGMVIELDRTKGEMEDALIFHAIPNLSDDHAVIDTQAIYVYFKESATGAIDFSTLAIVVDADNKTSENYNPNKGFGEYYYKLAVFGLSIDGVPSLTMVCAGSHIYHETGKTADYRVMSCEKDDGMGGVIPPVQQSRLRFVSGRLAGIDEDINDIPLSPYVSEVGVEICSG